MIQILPPAIMFAVTVAVCALFALPLRRVSPKSPVVRFYWRGVWMFLMAITAVAGAMNTLVLMDIDAVEITETLLNILLPAFVLFVVVGWFHSLGTALVRTLTGRLRGTI